MRSWLLLKEKETPTFKEFTDTFVRMQQHNVDYFYKDYVFNSLQKVQEMYDEEILNL